MYENLKWISAAVAVVGLTVGERLLRSAQSASGSAEEACRRVTGATRLARGAAIKHPLPAPETPEPLPPLDASDESLQTR